MSDKPVSEEFKGCSHPVPATSTLAPGAQEAVDRECKQPITPRITPQDDMHPWGMD